MKMKVSLVGEKERPLTAFSGVGTLIAFHLSGQYL